MTIAYFDDVESIAQWREQVDHRRAQALGREQFYESYVVQIAPIVRHYEWRIGEARGGATA